MDRVLKPLLQFRRIYSDNGSGDVDFTKQEGKLREAQARLEKATQALIKSSELLNQAAFNANPNPVKLN